MSETSHQHRATAGMKPRRWAYICGALALGLPVVLALCLWFAPSGTGEFCVSPDGQFEAHADNMSRGTLLGSREEYLELRVVEVATGREVWRVVHRHPAGVGVPDYGVRGMRFITWTANSSAVTIPVGGGREVILSVP